MRNDRKNNVSLIGSTLRNLTTYRPGENSNPATICIGPIWFKRRSGSCL